MIFSKKQLCLAVPLILSAVFLLASPELTYYLVQCCNDLSSGWYNVSPVYREKIIPVQFLTIIFSIVLFLFGFFKNDIVYKQLIEMPFWKNILALIVLFALFIYLIYFVGFLGDSKIDKSELSNRRYFNFLFNNIFGVIYLQFILLKAAEALGSYGRFFFNIIIKRSL